MIYREGESSIAIRELGTRYVSVVGMRLERGHGWSVELLDIHLVLLILLSEVNYTNTVLNLRISCSGLWTRQ